MSFDPRDYDGETNETASEVPVRLDWAKLGRELRISADDAHDGDTPDVGLAWLFLVDNPECFDYEEWPTDMPSEPPAALVSAYWEVPA